jgi:hypothetical protein
MHMKLVQDWSRKALILQKRGRILSRLSISCYFCQEELYNALSWEKGTMFYCLLILTDITVPFCKIHIGEWAVGKYLRVKS